MIVVARSEEKKRFDAARDEVVAFRVVNLANRFPKMHLINKTPDSNMGWEVRQSRTMFLEGDIPCLDRVNGLAPFPYHSSPVL